jgi:RHS repeat-associated protein
VGFAGGYTDATALIYLINRYYDPMTGQFVSVDPDVDVTGQDYSYAGDNPVNLKDGNGLKSCPPQSWGTLVPVQGSSGGFPINWLGIASDAATGYASGLAYRASALGAALRGGSSYAGGALRSAGETADMWGPLADAAIPFGGAITFGTDIASGQSVARSALNSAGVVVGGYGGAAVGGLACGALAAATDGVGSITCGFLTGAGAVVGGVVGGLVGDGIADLASWL